MAKKHKHTVSVTTKKVDVLRVHVENKRNCLAEAANYCRSTYLPDRRVARRGAKNLFVELLEEYEDFADLYS